jgi:hypothetical protein
MEQSIADKLMLTENGITQLYRYYYHYNYVSKAWYFYNFATIEDAERISVPFLIKTDAAIYSSPPSEVTAGASCSIYYEECPDMTEFLNCNRGPESCSPRPPCRGVIKTCGEPEAVDKIEKNSMTAAIRKYNNWYFIESGQKKGWISAGYLKFIPKDKIYLKNELKNPDKYFKERNEYLKIDWALKNFSADNPQVKALCPTDLKPFEEDGLFGDPINGTSLRDFKYQLFQKCNQMPAFCKDNVCSTHIEGIYTGSLLMITPKCDCFFAEHYFADGETQKKSVTAIYFNNSDIYGCYELRHHIKCFMDGDSNKKEIADDMIFSQQFSIACPKECLKWKYKEPRN